MRNHCSDCVLESLFCPEAGQIHHGPQRPSPKPAVSQTVEPAAQLASVPHPQPRKIFQMQDFYNRMEAAGRGSVLGSTVFAFQRG